VKKAKDFWNKLLTLMVKMTYQEEKKEQEMNLFGIHYK
jgi:hypothetical protein